MRARLRRHLSRQWRRLRRVDERVVRLPAAGESRGTVLFSYILDPLLLPTGAPVAHDHTHDWESLQMARTWVELGYDVDAVSWLNRGLVPAREYRAAVDVRLNLGRWAPHLPASCLKLMHCETAHHRVHNAAQLRRLAELRERRGIVVRPQKLIEPNDTIDHADCATVLGNRFTLDSYRSAGKPLVRVPISTPESWDFPEGKDFDRARRAFLWFGSGGLVHKGLDLVLDLFARLPHLELWVCGPVDRERDFERAYARELYSTPNIHTLGWVDIRGAGFREAAARCGTIVFPSCSEGGGGGVITCMHAGLAPVVSHEASVDVPAGAGRVLADSSLERLQAAVEEVAALDAAQLRAMAHAAWTHVRTHHTRDRFAARYREVIAALLDGGPDAVPDPELARTASHPAERSDGGSPRGPRTGGD